MFGTTFGHGTIRKYVIFFGTLFNNLWVKRYDNSNTLVQNMKVPLNYGPREKFLARLDGNTDLDRPIAIQLPRMSFELTNIYYDATRKMPTLNKIISPTSTDPENPAWQYMPVPYNFEFTLSIMVKNAEDGTYIIEQILPFFTPEWTATLNLNPDLGIKYDVPVVFESITHEDTYEGDFIQRRALIWTLTFTMKGVLFGPTKTTAAGLIKDIDVNMSVPPLGIAMADANSSAVDSMVTMNIVPGAYANGVATNNNIYTATVKLDNPTGLYEIGEKLTVNSTSYMYVVSSNSTAITARNYSNNITVGTTLTGEVAGVTATINSVSYAPPYPLAANAINVNSNYDFIINFMESY